MKSDGKYLEELVGFIEQQLLPMGFTVTFNECTRDEDGFQTAELDIVIRGSVGDTPIYWLIECRDRPGTGAVGISWIEQLKGRWIRFGFSKVSAVSTTGFSKVAS